MLDWQTEGDIPISWQADLISLGRGHLYYHPRPPKSQEVQVKHLGKNFVLPALDELYTELTFLGSRKIVAMLAADGTKIGRHTQRNGSAIYASAAVSGGDGTRSTLPCESCLSNFAREAESVETRRRS